MGLLAYRNPRGDLNQAYYYPQTVRPSARAANHHAYHDLEGFLDPQAAVELSYVLIVPWLRFGMGLVWEWGSRPNSPVSQRCDLPMRNAKQGWCCPATISVSKVQTPMRSYFYTWQ